MKSIDTFNTWKVLILSVFEKHWFLKGTDTSDTWKFDIFDIWKVVILLILKSRIDTFDIWKAEILEKLETWKILIFLMLEK